MKKALLFLAFVTFSSMAFGAQEEFLRIKIFSGLRFIPEEGDIVGLEIAIIPYELGQKKVLFRDAQSRLEEPLLLEASEDQPNKSLKFELPKGHYLAGKWTITEQGKRLLVMDPFGKQRILNRVY